MEAVACAHTFMAPVTAQSATEAVLDTISLDDERGRDRHVRARARPGDGEAAGPTRPAALPSATRARAAASAAGADLLTEESLLAAINEGATAPIDPDAKGPAELPVPAALMSDAR